MYVKQPLVASKLQIRVAGLGSGLGPWGSLWLGLGVGLSAFCLGPSWFLASWAFLGPWALGVGVGVRGSGLVACWGVLGGRGHWRRRSRCTALEGIKKGRLGRPVPPPVTRPPVPPI